MNRNRIIIFLMTMHSVSTYSVCFVAYSTFIRCRVFLTAVMSKLY